MLCSRYFWYIHMHKDICNKNRYTCILYRIITNTQRCSVLSENICGDWWPDSNSPNMIIPKLCVIISVNTQSYTVWRTKNKLHKNLPIAFISMLTIVIFVERMDELRNERFRIAEISLTFFSLPISTLVLTWILILFPCYYAFSSLLKSRGESVGVIGTQMLRNKQKCQCWKYTFPAIILCYLNCFLSPSLTSSMYNSCPVP